MVNVVKFKALPPLSFYIAADVLQGIQVRVPPANSAHTRLHYIRKQYA
jgi:hypothetical protein